MLNISILSVALGAAFVNAASPTKSNFLSWGAFAQKLEVEGTEEAKVGSMFTPPAGAIAKGSEVFSEDTSDAQYHGCGLAFDTSAPPPKRLWFVLSTKTPGLFKNERDDTYFQVDLDGELRKAIFGRIKLDENDNPIPGSGVTEVQDIKSPRIKELFQKEIDFWLKGMYRKNPAKKP